MPTLNIFTALHPSRVQHGQPAEIACEKAHSIASQPPQLETLYVYSPVHYPYGVHPPV